MSIMYNYQYYCIFIYCLSVCVYVLQRTFHETRTLFIVDTYFESKIVNIFSSISLNIEILGAQKNRLIETVLFECPQHMFWLRNKKINI